MNALQPSPNPLSHPVDKHLQYLISQDTDWSIWTNRGEDRGSKRHHLTKKPLIPIGQIRSAWFFSKLIARLQIRQWKLKLYWLLYRLLRKTIRLSINKPRQETQTNLLCNLNFSPMIQVWTLVSIWSSVPRIVKKMCEITFFFFFFLRRKEKVTGQNVVSESALFWKLQYSLFYYRIASKEQFLGWISVLVHKNNFSIHSSSIFSYSHPGIRISGKTLPKKIQRLIRQFPKTQRAQ